MSSILHNMDREREELQQRLLDFSLLQKLYPQISDVVEDLGYDCAVDLKRDSHCYDTFRIEVLQDDGPVGAIDVKFASATATGDYQVIWNDENGNKIDSEMVGRPDLIDVIESMVAAISKRQ